MNPNIEKARICILWCFAGLFVGSPQGQAYGQNHPTKIGAIDLQRAIWATAEGKRASTELKQRFAAREGELKALNVRIENLRRELAAGQTLGTLDVQQERRHEATRLLVVVSRKKRELTEDSQAAQAELLKHLTANMLQITTDYAATHGYMFVFDSSKAKAEVAYKAHETDLTDEMIRLYDQAHR